MMIDPRPALLAIPIFMVAYQLVGMLFDSRKRAPIEFSGDAAPAEKTNALHALARALAKFGPNRWILSRPKTRERFELLLMRSGYVFGWKPDMLLLMKELGLALAGLMLWQGEVTIPLFWVFGLYAGFQLPEAYVKGKVALRKMSIQRQLPILTDLLALAMESGLDLLAAVERIIGRAKPSPLREELATFIQENRLGTPRREALEHLAFRADVPDLQSLVGMIIQSEELGTSLSTVLRTFADDMRAKRIMRAEEAAGKAPVKLLFPMMVFFFPIVFVIIFGPLALNLWTSYNNH